MSVTKLITATTVALALVMSMSSTALAETRQEQELSTSSNVKVECTAGSYGQSSTCKAEANASASGKQTQILGDAIVCRDGGKCFNPHKVVNTGMDTMTLVTVAGTVLSGAGAAVIKLKK